MVFKNLIYPKLPDDGLTLNIQIQSKLILNCVAQLYTNNIILNQAIKYTNCNSLSFLAT